MYLKQSSSRSAPELSLIHISAQYQLTLTEEVEIRYRTETSTDPETGETTSEEVPYEYYILNVKLTSKPISAVASELLDVYKRQNPHHADRRHHPGQSAGGRPCAGKENRHYKRDRLFFPLCM